MSTPLIPTADQLAATRATLWHQSGDPILTLDDLRTWLNQAGLVLFMPRAQQLPSPAPSLVEAVLGASNPAPTLAESEPARTLTMRLIAEGSAVPLNLLAAQGTTGDAPDFICSAQVFSYIFTLRGDKTWRQPPATAGAVKVSPLGLATYELLAARVTMSAADLATELGKEVTEAAVLRGLIELWGHLRVLPVPQQDGTVLWELMSTRFTKQIKAGANAGQPSALSALISLYLGMAVTASEEEIETILSPLAPRSRIRDVLHALMGARQLETIAVGGRTVLHVSGDLPGFVASSPEVEARTEESIEVEAIAASSADGNAPAGRITKFVPKPRKTGTGPAKSFTPRPGHPASGRPEDRERRPFQKKQLGSPRPSFSKPPNQVQTEPWNEDRPPRPAINAEASSERRPGRPTFRDTPTFARSKGGTRPTARREDSSAPARRDFAPRSSSREAEDQRPPRKTFSKPGTFGRKRDQANEPRSFAEGGSRPPRRDFNARPPAPNAGPRPSFGPTRTDSRPAGSDQPGRPKRPFSDRPSPSRGERRPGSYSPRPPSSAGGFAGRKPYAPREDGASSAVRKPFRTGGKPPSRPSFSRDPEAPGGTEAPRKVFRKFDAPRFDRPAAPRGEGASSDRSKGSYAPRDKYVRSGSTPGGPAPGRPSTRPGSKPPGTFAKFADGNKPFRKPGPGGKKFGPKPSGLTGAFRKRKPEEGEA